MYLSQKIEQISFHYNDSRKIIAEFILKSKNKLHKYSMSDIAELTFTSKPTLVRFAKTLGFAGWLEFMKAYVEETYYQDTHYSDIDPNFPFGEEDSIEDIINKVCNLQVESLLDTADLFDVQNLKKATDIILSAAHIILFGISPNNLLGELFRRRMESIGILVHIPTLDESGMISRSLRENDCAIIISYSGSDENREPMRFMKNMKKNKVNVIGITSCGDNYLSENADIVFRISSRERLYSKISSFATEQSILHILNVLFSCCFSRNYKRNLDYKIQNSTELERYRGAAMLDMREEQIITEEER